MPAPGQNNQGQNNKDVRLSMSEKDPDRIVIFVPNWVGDVVMATPTLRALRKRFADSHIVYFGRPASLDVLAGTELADEMLVAKPRARSKTLGLLQLRGVLRKGRFDLAVLLTNSFRTAVLARMACIHRRVGYARDCRGWLLTEKLYPLRDVNGKYVPMSAIHYYANLSSLMGAPVESRHMSLAVTPDAERQAEELFESCEIDRRRPVVMLNPGAAFGTSKRWGWERFAAVADMLIEQRDAQIIINSAPSEAFVAQEVVNHMRHAPVLDFIERPNTLMLLKSLMKRSTLLITNDTGARHIGAAMGIGLVTVFGSTDPRWAQIDCDLERIVKVKVSCGPCQRKLCDQPPGPDYHQCMEMIEPNKVFEAACDMLDRTHQSITSLGARV